MNTSEDEMTRFQPGKTYYTRFACNADSVIHMTVERRTPKTVVTKTGKRYRIREHMETEMVHTGSYSMAPIFSADKVAT